MNDQEHIRSSEKQTISLVLSIFKGENFVVKDGGCRAFLRAKCADLQPEIALESGVVKLSPSTTDPEFNSQLAWSLSRRQLKELRSNRSVIRVTCIMVDERNGQEKEVGYLVMHVKDAVSFPKSKDKHVEVDPSKARTYSLLGTKRDWQSLQPKLHMILQLEDLDTPTQDIPKSRMIEQNKVKSNHNNIPARSPLPEPVNNNNDDLESDEVPIINAAALSETKIQQQPDASSKFIWTVRANDGYFLLGSPADHDDLYILNTTVISASYLHKLWDGKSPRKQGREDHYFWQIKYAAYGCDIASEPFLLGSEDISRRTFIGDKATARIRANGRLFYEYLQETSLEFHVVRYQLGRNKELTNEEVMGFCYVSLQDLGGPDNRELKLCMDVVSEWGTSKALSAHEKPEVRVMFTLEVIPNYFSIQNAQDMIAGSSELVHPEQNEAEEINNNPIEGAIKTEREQSNVRNTDDFIPAGTSESEPAEMHNVDEGEDVPDSVAEINIEDISNSSNVRRLLQFEGGIHGNLDNSESLASLGASVSTSFPRKRKIDPKHNGFNAPPPKFLTREISESEDSDFADKENLAKLMPAPGKYSVSIELRKFWLKSSRLLEEEFDLSYVHHPLGIQTPVTCQAHPLSHEFTEKRQDFIPSSNEFSTTINIQNYSERLINEPLTVEFRKNKETGMRCVAAAMIPFGRIFCEKEIDHLRILLEEADILKCNSNTKIGSLLVEIRLRREPDSAKQSAFFPTRARNDQESKPKVPSSKNDFEDVELEQMDKVTKEMRDWTRTKEEMYKRQKEEKETAYLKILSEEAAKRDAERETAMSKKLARLERKETEFNRQKRLLDEKAEELNKLEKVVKDKMRDLTLQQENMEHRSDLNRRKLEENHKIEVESLNRQVRGYQDEIEKLKTKLVVLEKKLETKDAEIDNLIALKRGQPDTKLAERVSRLEQENKTLRNQLREAGARKDQYRNQMSALCQKVDRLQTERDQELLDLNENLRLQILATKEHKELKKERKAVSEISQTLRALKLEVLPSTVPRDGKGDQVDSHSSPSSRRLKGNSSSSKDEEIRRLQAERNRLLGTGAYTQFDLVIKELEKKMVTLSQSQQ